MSAGLNFLYHSLRGKSMMGPRIGLAWYPDPVRTIRLQYGLIGATQIPQAYYVRGTGTGPLPNISLDLTPSDQFVLGYDQMITDDLSMKLEAYYQHHYDVPVGEADSISGFNSYSIVNAQDAFIDEPLINGVKPAT